MPKSAISGCRRVRDLVTSQRSAMFDLILVNVMEREEPIRHFGQDFGLFFASPASVAMQ